MAGVEIKGLEELRQNVAAFEKTVADEALKAAEDAAAQVVRQTVEEVAPRKTGQLASSVIVYESRDRRALSGQTRRRLLVGPGKRKGFYGFFLEKGWIWSKGRRKRAATGTTHSQSGPTEGRNRIPPHPWFPDQSKVEAKAYAAGEAAFTAVIEAETGKTR
jgi:hypothetical protein